MSTEQKWEWELKPQLSWYKLQLSELVSHRDLLVTFFRRELLAGYHQTVIGIFWIFLQPVLTTLFYFIVFGRIVRVSTDNAPPFLFYMSGAVIWNFFSECLNGTMFSFLQNTSIYNKVYFPRLVVPFSLILHHAVRFSIQFMLFLVVYFIYASFYFHPVFTSTIFLLPLLIIQVAVLASGIGLILSVYIARYRDIEYIMNFILRLFMFITPVVYPASIVPNGYKILFWLNPLTPIIETFRVIFFSNGIIHSKYLLVSSIAAWFVFAAGVIIFKKNEVKVMDII